MAQHFTEVVNPGYGSDDDMRRSHSNYGKKELVLPNVVANMANKENGDISADNINEGAGEDNDPYKPKM